MLDSESEAPAQAPKPPEASKRHAPGALDRRDIECDVVVIGAGPGGYSAAFRAADLGMKTVLVERYPTLGGVCLNVGCIPSKALLHTAAVMDGARALADHGITFGEPKVDLAKLRAFKDKVVGKLTGGLAGMAKMRKVTVVHGVGTFVDQNHLEVGRQEDALHVRDHRRRLAGGEAAVPARTIRASSIRPARSSCAACRRSCW